MAKVNPIVSWLDKDLKTISTLKYSGDANDPTKPVLADNDSAEVKIYIANNVTKGVAAAQECFDMTNCYLTVKDTNGAMDAPAVYEKWVQAKCISDGQSTFTAIGANKDEQNKKTEVSIKISSGISAKPQVIAGAINDGTVVNAKNNLAEIVTKIHPIFNTDAVAGKNQMRFRVVYTFGEEL